MICPHCNETTGYIRGSRSAYCQEYFTLDSDGDEEHDEYGDHESSDDRAYYTCPNCADDLSQSEVDDMVANGDDAPVVQVTPVKDAWKGLV